MVMSEDRPAQGLVVAGAVVLVIVMAAALIHNFVPPAASGSQQITQTFQVGARPLLVINGRNSNVDVHSGSAGNITVQIQAHNSDALLDSGTELRSRQALDSQGYDRLSVTTSPAYENASTASGNVYNAFGSNITGGPARAQLSATVMHGSVSIEKAP